MTSGPAILTKSNFNNLASVRNDGGHFFSYHQHMRIYHVTNDTHLPIQKSNNTASLLARPSQRTAAAPGLRPAAKAAPLHRDPPAPGSVGLGLSPPVLARRSAAVSAPRSPRYALRAARTAPALGPPARPWAASGGPAAHPTRHCGFASGPSAPLPRRVPPKTAPSASCPPSSLGRLAAWAGCGLRSSRPGPGAALAVRFLRPPAPGALGRRQMQQRDSGVIQGGFRLIERSLGGGEPPQRLPCITLNLICC